MVYTNQLPFGWFAIKNQNKGWSAVWHLFINNWWKLLPLIQRSVKACRACLHLHLLLTLSASTAASKMQNRGGITDKLGSATKFKEFTLLPSAKYHTSLFTLRGSSRHVSRHQSQDSQAYDREKGKVLPCLLQPLPIFKNNNNKEETKCSLT